MFEKATRMKLRWKASNGTLTVEDLWDLKLEPLDKIAKDLRKELKESEEESFIKPSRKTAAYTETLLKFEVVKHIITVKLEEAEVAALAKEKREKRARIMEIIKQKEDQELSGKGLDELRKLLNEE